MPLDQLFKLSKLTLDAYKHAERKASDRLGSLEVQLNPETLSFKHEVAFERGPEIGGGSKQAKFSHAPPRTLAVNLVIDGTQVGEIGFASLLQPHSVRDRIKRFLDLCYQIQGPIHEPAYLRLSWDQGVLEPYFDCRLQSVDIKYTAFDRDGSPLHAELLASFIDDMEAVRQAAIERKSSPDLTHTRVVRAGDTLPLLCIDIYGSASHYLRVAEANGLDDFRELRPGQALIFPPFARRAGA